MRSDDVIHKRKKAVLLGLFATFFLIAAAGALPALLIDEAMPVPSPVLVEAKTALIVSEDRNEPSTPEAISEKPTDEVLVTAEEKVSTTEPETLPATDSPRADLATNTPVQETPTVLRQSSSTPTPTPGSILPVTPAAPTQTATISNGVLSGPGDDQPAAETPVGEPADEAPGRLQPGAPEAHESASVESSTPPSTPASAGLPQPQLSENEPPAGDERQDAAAPEPAAAEVTPETSRSDPTSERMTGEASMPTLADSDLPTKDVPLDMATGDASTAVTPDSQVNIQNRPSDQELVPPDADAPNGLPDPKPDLATPDESVVLNADLPDELPDSQPRPANPDPLLPPGLDLLNAPPTSKPPIANPDELVLPDANVPDTLPITGIRQPQSGEVVILIAFGFVILLTLFGAAALIHEESSLPDL